AIICVYQSILLKCDIFEVISNQVENEKVIKDLFFLNLTANVIEHKPYLTKMVADKLSNWTFDRLGFMEQAILLVAVAELLSEDADKAVVINEAIEYAKKYTAADSYKFINGVLDQL
ncbi:MAG: transcription antitermination factor NusB, partial [Erysipelothrix sp.]|nr:transcription antitermination factor NusB [Erysipelothrix sp.]